jgi:hypothetical protein
MYVQSALNRRFDGVDRVTVPLYHSYDAQPSPFFNPETGSVDHNSHSYAHYSAQSSPTQSTVGLMQPAANGFIHHG